MVIREASVDFGAFGGAPVWGFRPNLRRRAVGNTGRLAAILINLVSRNQTYKLAILYNKKLTGLLRPFPRPSPASWGREGTMPS
jgi:hypothetical protein